MPVLSTILAVAGLAASGVGIGESVAQGNAQQGAIKSQLDIAKQEEARKQAVYQQLAPFYESYMASGSPYLAQTQRAGAEQTAVDANNAAGQIREVTGASGLGYGPSGTTAAALGGLGAETGRTASSNYLTNLLNNEMLKFQAAQGLSAAGQGQQISPQPGQYPINPIPGSVGSFGTALQNLLKQFGGNQVPGTPPGGSNAGSVLGPIIASGVPAPVFPGSGGAPTTSGWGFGPD
jgi:hypothetical protein